jgi:uncharacterized protein (DUF2252 family)
MIAPRRAAGLAAVAFIAVFFIFSFQQAKRKADHVRNSLQRMVSLDGPINDRGRPPLPDKICQGWCPPRISALDRVVRSVDCTTHTIQEHIRAALQMENCPPAMQSESNARDVEQKLIKLADNDVFVFFRGAAGFFDLDLMCMDPNFQGKKRDMPRVVSNGDAHPENFGTQVMVNGKLMWGVNDFDQSFPTPFSWDLKRSATGTEVACRARGWNDVVCKASVHAFVGAYLDIAAEPNVSSVVIPNQDRFIEGSRASERDGLLVQLFKRARKSESDEEILKWLRDDLNVDTEKDRFFQTERTTPLPDEVIPEFQSAIEAYLFHGVPAVVMYPWGEFWKVLAVAKRSGSGTGSIGLNRYYILLRGKKSTYGGRIVVEMKQEIHSLLEMFFRYKFTESEQGKRAVDAVRGAYPYTNPFYGWTMLRGHAYVVREKSKHEKTVKLDELTAEQYLDYAVLCGRALAMYHFKMQCADHMCLLDDAAEVDRETWASVSDYIRSYGVEDFREMITAFAFKETERQIDAWDWLRTVVRQTRARQESPLWLLNLQLPGVDTYCQSHL